MDRLLSLIPKNLLAVLVIGGGILFIVLSRPPVTICDAQLDVIRQSQKNFLYPDEKTKAIKTTKFERLRDHCKMTNNPGGCYELFQELKTLSHDISGFSSECLGAVGALPPIKKALWESTQLLIQMAWGEAPPQSYSVKFNWLDTSDLSLFCKMKNQIIGIYGEDDWTRFREKMMQELPGAKDVQRSQVWDMSLFSENCARYP